jgi:hypothetical protein
LFSLELRTFWYIQILATGWERQWFATSNLANSQSSATVTTSIQAQPYR